MMSALRSHPLSHGFGNSVSLQLLCPRLHPKGNLLSTQPAQVLSNDRPHLGKEQHGGALSSEVTHLFVVGRLLEVDLAYVTSSSSWVPGSQTWFV